MQQASKQSRYDMIPYDGGRTELTHLTQSRAPALGDVDQIESHRTRMKSKQRIKTLLETGGYRGMKRRFGAVMLFFVTIRRSLGKGLANGRAARGLYGGLH